MCASQASAGGEVSRLRTPMLRLAADSRSEGGHPFHTTHCPTVSSTADRRKGARSLTPALGNGDHLGGRRFGVPRFHSGEAHGDPRQAPRATFHGASVCAPSGLAPCRFGISHSL